jgi:hypothetical protein
MVSGELGFDLGGDRRVLDERFRMRPIDVGILRVNRRAGECR